MSNKVIRALVLEDSKERVKEFKRRFEESPREIIADFTETSADCISKLKTEKYHVVFLDHDLGDEVFVSSDREDTGAEVARWVSENFSDLEPDMLFIVHSMNPDGRKYISSKIPGSFELEGVWVKSIFSKLSFH